jgi:ribonuclease T2
MLERMKRREIALFLFFVVVAGCRSRTPATAREAAEPATAQTNGSGFDYYLLNLSWSPEFCYSHRSAAECAAHDTFVLHGLWPENNDGTYPENCPDAPGPADPGQYNDLYPDAGLLEHEWRTHGTCTGLSADAFFTTARKAYQSVKIPPSLENLKAQTSMAPEEILGMFTDSNPGIPRSSLVLSCGHNYLTAVEVCLDKGLHPVPCSGVRSCRANTVRIPAP